MRTRLRKIGMWVTEVTGFAELRAEQFAPDVARRYRRDQIKATLSQSKFLLLGNIFIAPIFGFQGLEGGPVLLVGVWTIMMMLVSLLLFLWTWSLKNTNGEVSDMTRVKVRALLDGSMWTAGIVCVYPSASGEGKVIIAVIMTGAVALGTFGYARATVPALIYLACTALGGGLVGFMTGLKTGSYADQLLLPLAIFAFTALAEAVKALGKGELRSFQNFESLSEKTEVVELLLKDYEAQAEEWTWRSDPRGNLTVVPEVIRYILGGNKSFPNGKPILQILDEKHSQESATDFERMAQAVRTQREFHDISLSFRDTETDDLRWVAIKGRPQFDNGVFTGFRGIAADKTQAVLAEQRVNYLASFDSLTGLLNRNSVQIRLGRLDPQVDKAAVFLIDLDGFKQINDSYGHDVGDALLKAAAERINSLAGAKGWTARLAGDEFIMFREFTGEPPIGDLVKLGQSICSAMADPFRIGDFELQISASVGIARFPGDTSYGFDLLSLSDLALYGAKSEGRDRPMIFNRTMQERQIEHVAITDRLRRAIRTEAIQLHYQPRHDLSTGRLLAFEALARWHDEALGLIGPDKFIPIAEQTGLIVALGEQLLLQAAQEALHWYQAFGEDAPGVSVNISPVQFARIDVAALMGKVLDESGLPARFMEIEITENVLISDRERVASTLREIHDLGVAIALDDFGTGYSSLSYLKDLPLSRLKIDRSFVGELESDELKPIIRTIIELGRNLDLCVLAEGIETRKQLEKLQALNCDEGQGYFLSRPMPPLQANHYAKHVRHQRPWNSLA